MVNEITIGTTLLHKDLNVKYTIKEIYYDEDRNYKMWGFETEEGQKGSACAKTLFENSKVVDI